MKITKDKKTNTAYVQFRKGTVSRTAKLHREILIDYDKKGQIVGIEILSAAELAPALKLVSRTHGPKGKSAA